MEEIPLQTPPKKSVLRRILKIVFVLVLFVVALLGTLAGLLVIYEDEVKSAIITELNKHLKAEVKIAPGDIDLTIVKTFPDCSIEFRNLVMMEALATKKRDTLLYAGKLGLLFNAMDIWNKQYNIKSIVLSKGFARPAILKNGNNNYTFWQSDKSVGSDTDSLRFNLNRISITEFNIVYKDRQQKLKAEGKIDQLEFKGNFEAQNYLLETSGTIFVNQVTKDNVNVLKEKSVELAVELDVQNTYYKFKKADVSLNNLRLELDGGFFYRDSIARLNVNYKAPELDIASLLSLLPDQYKEKINDYESSGLFYAKGNLRYENKQDFALKSEFGVKDGQITYKPNSTTAREVNLDGKVWLTSKTSVLELNNVSWTLNTDKANGSLKLSNFSDPLLSLKLNASLQLENVQSFIPIDTIQSLKGGLQLNTVVEGKWSDLKDKTFTKEVSLELEAAIAQLEVKFKGDEKVYAVESCSLTALNREIEVQNLVLKRGSSDLKLNGKIPGIFNYLSDRSNQLVISGSLYAGYIKLEDFLPENYKSDESNDNPLIPQNMEFNFNAAIEKFSFAKFEASNITGEIEIRNQKAIANGVRLNTMEGEAEIDAFADNSGNNLKVVMRSSLQKINIASLFKSFNNFSQSTMTDANLKGFATATVDFSGTWNNRLEADLGSIRSDCYLLVERGELIDFKPLLSLSSYVDIKDLQRIKFSSLQSHIDIAGQIIRIPKTSIQNSALNIDVWGTHSFNNDMDYHIKLLISEYMAKKRNKNDDEFGKVLNDPEDRRSAFILMTGTVDNPIIKYDRKGLKEKLKEDIKREKQTLKELKEQFREDIGLGRKDSTARKPKKQEPAFELEKPNVKPQKKPQDPAKENPDDDDF